MVWAALLIGLFIVPSVVSAASFPDVKEDYWAYEEIEELANKGVMSGFSDGTFRPNEPVKRIQAAAMLVKELGLEKQSDESAEFHDISDDFPQKEVVDIMAETGILRGSEGNFRPYEPLSRAQMASIMTRALDLQYNKDFYFFDIQPDFWNYSDISSLANSGITGGKGDGTFAPSEATTRAQFVTFLHRATDDAHRKPIEPLAGDYGQYVFQDGLLYGYDDRHTVSVYQMNENKEYERIESYSIEDTDYYKEASAEDQSNIFFSVENKLQARSQDVYGLIEDSSGFHRLYIQDGNLSVGGDGPLSSSYNYYLNTEDAQYVESFSVTDGKLLHYKISEYTDEVEELREVSSAIHYAGSHAFFQEGNQIISYDLISNKEKTVYSNDFHSFTLFDGELIVTRQDGMIIMDLDGKVTRVETGDWSQGTYYEETAHGLEIYLNGTEERVAFVER